MRRHLILLLGCASMATVSAEAQAQTWVDRPLVLGPYQAGFDLGVGWRAGAGVGSDLAWRLGLPVLTELDVRTGARFDDRARAAGTDGYARLFDHETSNQGGGRWANPELRACVSLAAFRIATVGLETRVVVPAAAGTRVVVAPGVPVRFRFAHRARVDTGLLFPLGPGRYGVSVPAELWLQAGDAFVGALTGVRFRHDDGSHVDVEVGLGAGVTVARVWDLRAQVFTPRINEGDPGLGVGAGAGVTVP